MRPDDPNAPESADALDPADGSHGASALTNARRGTLVAYQAGVEIGRERFIDDGRALASEVSFAGANATLTIERDPARLRVQVGGQSAERELPAGTIALPNGQWQAYAIAGEVFTNTSGRQPVQVIIGTRAPPIAAFITVSPSGQGSRRVEVEIGATAVSAIVDPDGAVARVEIPSQNLEVLREGESPRVPVARVAPSGIAEESFDVERGGVMIRGSLWRPADASGRIPVVVFVAGSGPTDRDGNNPPMLVSDAYRMMAEGLAHGGVASMRFDKRGVGASGRNFDASRVVFQDFVDDAAAVFARARSDQRFSRCVLAGHSEGGLIALEVAQRSPPDRLVLLATAGRTMADLLREQLNRGNDPVAAGIIDGALAAIAAGNALPADAAPLAALFSPAVMLYMRSVLELDPVPLVRSQRAPTTVIQGETDVQVSVADARLLSDARSGIQLVSLPGANHLFKQEAARVLPQASYTDPALPIVPEAMAALLAAARH